ncbi:MAG: hypothetical protein EHM46_02005 [Bacteroidetes bacterium]|nr:MAG: hypothetical protein EHM46_02005 [Bacteroidota bacterium]
MLLFSCDLDTRVINTVHRDGSVTRKVIMKGGKDSVFDPEFYRVPVDSSWTMVESCEIGEENDTTWILTAEKWFAGVDEINQDYMNDSGTNRILERSAHFTKSFRWFINVYRFSERVETILDAEVPASEFLDEEELKFYYMPDQGRQELFNSPDSVRFRDLEERVDSLAEIWTWTAFVRQWIDLFYEQAGNDPGLKITREEMMALTPMFIRQLLDYDIWDPHVEGESEGMDGKDNSEEDAGDQDLWNVIVPVLGKEFYRTYSAVIDSAGAVLETMLEPFFGTSDYDVEIRMPGRITGSNGYAVADPDSAMNESMLWKVTSEYFLTMPYEMWVESRESNYWAWIVTAVFLVFVIFGLLLRRSRKMDRS